MKKIFICLLILNFQVLRAQTLEWFDGSIVLSTGEVRVGTISPEASHDLILFQQGELRMVYPAHAIKAFYFYDKPADINRRYVSLKEQAGVQVRHALYEVVISGDVSVVRRKKMTAFPKNTDAN